MSATKDYRGLTRDMYERLRRELSNEGSTTPTGDVGTFAGPHGIQWRSEYDPTAQVLHLRILDKPLYILDAQVWRKVDAAVEHARTA